MEITIFDITLISILVILALIWLKTITVKNKLEQTEKIFEDEQVFADCSDLSHGMVLNNDRIEADEKPSLSWISRLAG